MNEITHLEQWDDLYPRIRDILSEARRQDMRAVNIAMVTAYWGVGRIIVEEEQRGALRAEYGKRQLEEIAMRLSKEFGKGFDYTNLWRMRIFYIAYPIIDAVRRKLS